LATNNTSGCDCHCYCTVCDGCGNGCYDACNGKSGCKETCGSNQYLGGSDRIQHHYQPLKRGSPGYVTLTLTLILNLTHTLTHSQP
jgi:hypothetical protein